MSSVGVRLRQARRAQKRSIREVSADTKIQPWVLEALEEDRLQDGMSPVYARGFLMTYARFLRLDPEPLLADVPWPTPVAEADEALPPPMPLPNLKIAIPWEAMRAAGRRVRNPVLVAAGIAVVIALNPLQWLPRVTLPHRQAAISIVTEPAPKAAAKSALEEIKLAPSQPLNLTARVRGTTWVQVRADGKLLTQQRLQRGAEELWIAKRQLELVIAKPSQVELALNGHSISPLAVAHHGRLLITHDGITALSNESP